MYTKLLHTSTCTCTCTYWIDVVHDLLYKYTIFIIIWTLDEWGELASHQRSLTHHSRFSRLGIQCSIFPYFSKPLWLLIF